MVLMDFEWFENERYFTPTQLAALRVSDTWEVEDSFFTRFQPIYRDDYRGVQIGWTGGSRREYLQAPEVMNAMQNFAEWLQPSDLMLWWEENVPETFQSLWQFAFNTEFPAIGIMQKAVRQHFALTHGQKLPDKLLGLAKLTKDGACLPAHDARNDVENFRRVLHHLQRPMAAYTEAGCVRRISKAYCDENGTLPRLRWHSTVVAGKYSRRKLFHQSTCQCLRHSTADTIITFPNLVSASNQGYQPCDQCLSIGHYYHQERESILVLSEKFGITCTLGDQCIHIISKYDVWRVVLDNYSGKPALFHHNKHEHAKVDAADPIANFHRQKAIISTITDAIKYIANHDAYTERRKEQDPVFSHQTHTRKATKHRQEAKRKTRKIAANRVLAIIDELAAMHVSPRMTSGVSASSTFIRY